MLLMNTWAQEKSKSSFGYAWRLSLLPSLSVNFVNAGCAPQAIADLKMAIFNQVWFCYCCLRRSCPIRLAVSYPTYDRNCLPFWSVTVWTRKPNTASAWWRLWLNSKTRSCSTPSTSKKDSKRYELSPASSLLSSPSPPPSLPLGACGWFCFVFSAVIHPVGRAWSWFAVRQEGVGGPAFSPLFGCPFCSLHCLQEWMSLAVDSKFFDEVCFHSHRRSAPNATVTLCICTDSLGFLENEEGVPRDREQAARQRQEGDHNAEAAHSYDRRGVLWQR